MACRRRTAITPLGLRMNAATTLSMRLPRLAAGEIDHAAEVPARSASRRTLRL